MAKTTILGVFDQATDAQHALGELRESGLQLYDTSLVAHDQAEQDKLSAPEGAAVGAAWGGLVGLVALAIPGIGPFIAGGAIVAAMTGAAAGAVVGGIGGALAKNNSLPTEDAERYALAVQNGKTLVVVQADEAHALDIRRILARDGADSIRENQTDMLHNGAIAVDMYDEGGSKINSPYGEVVSIERMGNAGSVTSLFAYQGSAIGDREMALNDQDVSAELPTTSGASGAAGSFDLEDRNELNTGFANGARVVSYEDAETTTPAPAPAMPKDVEVD